MAATVDHEWLTPAETASALGCSRARVFALGKAGLIARREVNGSVEHPRWAYSARSVEAYAATCAEISAARTNLRRDVEES
jgi:hypothetical protein